LAQVSPTDLGIKAAREVFARSGISPQDVGAVITGSMWWSIALRAARSRLHIDRIEKMYKHDRYISFCEETSNAYRLGGSELGERWPVGSIRVSGRADRQYFVIQ
jgi:hypothetical protein